ncbi:unnamed protein product [Cyclocybe aegerita]|uniref:Uncharacterized protein n=1 Tax=Cyclocybe aegerita TaxID=1973307 RepID=A0A8S0W617_CYCAE|nr:unnamed protein product [Cyclocybe aegerita]
MVKITTSVVLAAILVAPSIAAPIAADYQYIDAREPQGLRAAVSKIGKLFTSKRVAAGASVAAAAGGIAGVIKSSQSEKPAARDLEELEELAAREPIFGKLFGAAKKIGGGALKVAAGALSGRELEELEELAARDDIQELLARDLRIRTALRAVGKHITSSRVAAAAGAAGAAGTIAATAKSRRDLEEVEELAARDPRIRAALGAVRKHITSNRVTAAAGAAGAAGTIAGTAKARELADELDARDPLVRNLVKKVVSGAMKVGGGLVSMPPLGRRELEDLEVLVARDPLVRNLIKKVASAAKKVGRNLNPMLPLGRDLENVEGLETRAIPRKGRGRSSSRTASSSIKPVGASADIMVREPVLGKLTRSNAFKKAGPTLTRSNAFKGRDLEDIEGLAAHDPLVRNLVKKVVRGAMKVGGGLVAMPPLGRDLEYVEELATREYYDELD